MRPFADIELARRVEAGWAADLLAQAEAGRRTGVYPEAAATRIGGGVVAWLSPGNPVNGAVGVGLSGPVEQEEVAALVAFLEERGEAASVDVCPLADRSLIAWAARYGFVVDGFENVLYRPLPAPEPSDAEGSAAARRATTEADLDLWADVHARGFADNEPTDADRALAMVTARRDDAVHVIGMLDGVPAGTGMLCAEGGGLARLGGDATVPELRNRGVQAAMLGWRLRHAEQAGCDLASIEAAPGSASQRNQERFGFVTAYTRTCLVRAVAR